MSRRSFSILSAMLLLAPLGARADGELEAAFTDPVIVGQTTNLVISLADETPFEGTCETVDYAFTGEGFIDWGDGSPRERWHLLQFTSKPTAKVRRPIPQTQVARTVQHSFPYPGRWIVKVSYEWDWYLGGCPNQSGEFIDWVTIDVQPNQALVANGAIGSYFDANATICASPAPFGTVLYIVATLAGQSTVGVAGAEFRLRTNRPGVFSFIEEAPTGWIKIGNAFGDGVTLGGPCGEVVGEVVLLKLTAMPLVEASDINLMVDRHLNPSNGAYADPILVLCDAPFFTAIGVGRGVAALLNPSDGSSSTCTSGTVAIQQGSWTRVKSLYRP